LTTNDIEKHIQLIITKSQQLLTRLEYDFDSDESFDVVQTTQIQAEREQLIAYLFNQYPGNEIAKEQQLIHQMVNLDSDLQIKTEALKQAFASKLIQIKKGKKSTLTYKKY
jgi:hypothetical protein